MRTYEKVLETNKKYKGFIAWRIKKHSAVIDDYLDENEDIIFAFAAQETEKPFNIISTSVLALTEKRLLIGCDIVPFGKNLSTITPDLYNDMTIYKGIFWGKITIDTVKETVVFKNIPNAALDEIETIINQFMMKEKQKYGNKE